MQSNQFISVIETSQVQYKQYVIVVTIHHKDL